MSDAGRSREELLAELRSLRARVIALERSGERGRAEAVKRVDEKFRALLAAGGQGVWTASAEGELEPDEGWVAYSGLTLDELRGFGWLDAVHPDDRAATVDAWSTARATLAPYRIEHRVRRADGVFRWFRGLAVPVLAPDGRPRGWIGVHQDVTEALEEAEARRRGEARFRALFESPLLGVGIIGRDGRPREANAFLAALFGRSPDELRRATWPELAGREQNESSRRHLEELRRRGFGTPFEASLLKPDGSQARVIIGSARLHEEDADLSVMVDVTERYRAEQRVQLLSEASQALAEGLDDAEAALARLVDAAARTVADYGYVDLLEGDLFRRVGARHRDPALQPAVDAAVGGRTARHPESPTARALRERRAVLDANLTPERIRELALNPEHEAALQRLAPRSLVAAPIFSAGRPLGVIVLAASTRGRDLGSRDLDLAEELARRAAHALQLSQLLKASQAAERRARFLAESGNVLALSLDLETTLASLARLSVPGLAPWCLVDVLDASGELRRMAMGHLDRGRVRSAWELVRRRPELSALWFDLPRVLATGASVRSAPPARPELPEDVRDALASLGMGAAIALPLQSRGRTLGAVTLAAGTEDELAAIDLRLADEVSRRAALAVDAALLYRSATEAVRARDEFLSIASHELRTPLTPLTLKLQVLEPLIPPHSAEHLEIAQRQVSRLASLVDELLDVTRISSGRLLLSPQLLDVSALVRDVCARYAPQAERAGVRLTCETTGELRATVDRARAEQVVVNLLSNAIKYGAGKPVLVTVHHEADHAVISVRDHGIGIAPEARTRIFDRFERAVSERHYGGLGLGLYITRRIVDAHGGSVDVESEVGKGSTFRVRLPLTLSER